MPPFTERRMPHTEQDSLDLVVSQSGETMRVMLSMATQLGEMQQCLRDTNTKVVDACRLGEEAITHARDTRELLESHIKTSAGWELLITKLEADLEGREFWRKVGRIFRSGVTKFIAIVAGGLGLVVTFHAALPHIRDFLRGH